MNLERTGIEMKVSDNSVRFEIGIWRGEKGEIHITATDPEIKKLFNGFHSTVNDRSDSKRCHKNLFGKLEAVLNKANV